MIDLNKPIDTIIRLLVLSLLIIGSFWIMAPFILLLIWAVVVAVAIYPLYKKFEKLFGSRTKLSAILFTVLMVLLMIYPLWAVSGSLIEYTQSLASILEDGSISIPPADPRVKDWPIFGHKLFAIWQESSQNLDDVLVHFEDQIITLSSSLLSGVAGFGFTMLQFLFAVIISGILLSNRKKGIANAQRFIDKVSGENSDDFLSLIGGTIRSVSQGVIGIAAIQALLAYFGFWLVEVPGAEFWAIGVLVVAIVQLPPTLIILPIIIYVFSISSTTVAAIFAIYSVLVSLSDSFLKPIFLGRGVDVPMLVVLIGSIGGMLAFGIIGLFIGPIILAILYKLYLKWLNTDS